MAKKGKATVREPMKYKRPDQDPLLQMTDLAIETGISDLATNINHYQYGHPKAGDTIRRGTLADFFATSPLRGSGLGIERSQDRPQPVELDPQSEEK